MAPRVFGAETEYALSALRRSARPADYPGLLLRTAVRHLVHLPASRESGLFLANGSRLYVDAGGHPELSTPEVQDPWSLVRYVKAGDRILHDLARRFETAQPRQRLLIRRGNVDYGGTGATWGFHESYLHTSTLSHTQLAEQLVPHLVSRIVFAGSGGFRAGSAGIEFTISPRAWHLRHAIAGSSTSTRGIFHTREQSLSGPGYRRMHLLCCDSLCSETALWLVIGTTALVVALIEAGKQPGSAVSLGNPVRALRKFAGDRTLGVRVRLAGGRLAGALEIQRHYLEHAERYCSAGFMPSWAEDVCARWRQVLELLQHDPHALARTLDWTVKAALYDERIRKSNVSRTEFELWNSVLRELPAFDWQRNRRVQRGELDPFGEGLDDEPALADEALQQRGLRWQDAEPFLRLRAELMELETRYGVLGEDGIFEQLDRGGVLEHRVPGVEPIADAIGEPPSAGRARLRGEAIRRLAADGGSSCHWSEVRDGSRSRKLDLSNPYETEERWRPIRPSAAERLRELHTRLRAELL